MRRTIIYKSTEKFHSRSSAKNSISSPKKSPAKSPVVSKFKETIELRKGVGRDSLDAAGEGKLAPTPRRSIHSFRVSDSTKAVVNGTREGAEKGRVVSSEPSASGGCMKSLIKLLILSAVLALLAALYLAFINTNDEANSFDQIIDAVNTAQAEAPHVDL